MIISWWNSFYTHSTHCAILLNHYCCCDLKTFHDTKCVMIAMRVILWMCHLKWVKRCINQESKCRSRALATETLRRGSGWGRSRRRRDGGRHCRCGRSSGALSWHSTGAFTRIEWLFGAIFKWYSISIYSTDIFCLSKLERNICMHVDLYVYLRPSSPRVFSYICKQKKPAVQRITWTGVVAKMFLKFPDPWMSQEVSKRFVVVGYNPNILYIPFISSLSPIY